MFPLDYLPLRRMLANEGWRTPQAYDCAVYSEPGNFSAVYLFLAVDVCETDTCAPLYVGMSKNLVMRWQAHPTLRGIQRQVRYVQKWFLPVAVCDLRAEERNQIQRFDPPWNITGKRRGFK